MRFYRPHSFFTLLLIAFFFVCMPLLVALYSSVQIMDGLVQQSVSSLHNSVERLKRSREVTDLFQNQERMARLYNVLGEPIQLQEVNTTHHAIEKALEDFLPYYENKQLTPVIEELLSRENYISSVLNRFSSDPEKLKKEKAQVLAQYKEIDRLTSKLLSLSNILMVEDVNALKSKVNADKKELVWQTSCLIFFTVLFCVIFILLIFKPIRQINKSIESLGGGDFETPVRVSGPRDLEDLGTKLDWLRKRLAKLDREKVKMIAHISHDLKTPLASIREGAGLLQDELVGPINEKQKEIVTILEKNCSKLQRLIEDILNFNMAKAREIPLEKNHIQLDKIIEEVVADHRNSVLARNIQLDVELPSVAMYGNRKQLKTVFDNLVSNAVKFTPEDGTIDILLESDKKTATCFIEDSGAGVNEEDRPQIFSPFFQGKKSEMSIIEGSGLGLAMSKEYVENHDGTIRLLPSKNGARFCVTLPLTENKA